METVDVLLSGNILPGADLADAAAQLSGLTGLNQEQARALISSGKERVVKRGISAALGQKYQDKLTAIGVETRLRSAAGAEATKAAAPTLAASAPQPGQQVAEQIAPPSPPANSDKRAVQAAPAAAIDPGAINPYSAPKAAMDERRSGSGLENEWRDAAAKVPASHGYHWFKDAWSLFSGQKGTWIGVTLLVFGISIAASALLPPIIANIISTFIWPLFGGGIAFMAHKQSEGESIAFFDIFAGIKQNPVQLLLIGLLIFVYVAVVFALGFFIVGQSTFMALAGGVQGPEFAQQTGKIVLVFLVVMLLLLPVMLGAVFAPTLVTLGGRSAFTGLYKGSFAGLKNWSAVLVNGLVLFLVSGGVGMVAGLFFGLAGGLLGGSSLMTILVIGLAAVVLFLPLFAALSIMPYTASRDIFYGEA